MKDWLRFNVAFWHTFRGDGGDPFGSATKLWPWDDGSNSLNVAARRMRTNFKFLKKLGVEKWCFHDRNIAPEGSLLEASFTRAMAIADLVKSTLGPKGEACFYWWGWRRGTLV